MFRRCAFDEQSTVSPLIYQNLFPIRPSFRHLFPAWINFLSPGAKSVCGPFHFFMTINEEQFVNYCGSSMTRLRRHLSVYGTNDCGFLQSKIISTKFPFYVENKGKSIELLLLVLLRRSTWMYLHLSKTSKSPTHRSINLEP